MSDMSRNLAALLAALSLLLGSGWRPGAHLHHRPGQWHHGPVTTAREV